MSPQPTEDVPPPVWKGSLMVAVFSTVSILNGFMFVATASVETLAKKHYNASDTEINFIGQSVFAGYIAGLPLYAIVYSKRDSHCLRLSLVLAALFNGIGAALRLLSNTYLVILGTGLTGLSIPFFLGMPTSLAASWFRTSHNSLAVSICAMANQFGIALGFLIPPLLIEEDDLDSGFQTLNRGTAVAAAASFCLVLLLFSENSHAATEAQMQLQPQVKKSCSDPMFLLLCATFGVVVSIYWNVAILLSESLDEQFTTDQIGIFGTVLMSSGAAGMVLTGIPLQLLGNYKRHISVLLVLSCICLGVFAALVQQHQVTEASMLPLCAVLGFLMPSVQAPLLELAVITCPYLDEFVSGSLVFFWTMVFAIVLTIATTLLSVQVLYYGFVGLFALVSVLFLFMAKNAVADASALQIRNQGPRRRSFNGSYAGSFSGTGSEDSEPLSFTDFNGENGECSAGGSGMAS